MRSMLRLSAFAVFLLVCLAGSASAQIMWITTDNPFDNTVLNPSGTTLLTITLDPWPPSPYCTWVLCTGPTASCWSGTGQECINQSIKYGVSGYYIILSAVGGTVTWGTFTPADAAYVGGQTATSTQVEFYYSQYPHVSADVFTVGTIPVTTTSPFTTHIEFARTGPSRYGTWLDMGGCQGAFGRGYLLGDYDNPCAYGVATDWFDAYGVRAPTSLEECLVKPNHGQCEVCCKSVGGTANSCSKLCSSIKKGIPGEPQP